jgi:DNA polymerase-3 subunit delta'
MLDLIGHDALRAKLSAAVARGTLPASILLHGAPATGKERLALWLGALILCNSRTSDGNACGTCQECRYAAKGAHPDLHWYFPRPRLKDADPDVEDVLADFNEAIADRMEATGAWTPPAPGDSLYVATIRALVRRASMTPALASRKVIVVADAERMGAQEGSEEAANAFLKLLEEPPADTTVILTSSAPGALLPTIRSRAVSVRVPPLTTQAARELAAHARPSSAADATARTAAEGFLRAAAGDAATRYRAAFGQSVAGARGAYTETLDALTHLLHERTRDAVAQGREQHALGATRAIELVENAKLVARHNVNPQLISARLLSDLAPLVGDA